jgi:hypothetical protein
MLGPHLAARAPGCPDARPSAPDRTRREPDAV